MYPHIIYLFFFPYFIRVSSCKWTIPEIESKLLFQLSYDYEQLRKSFQKSSLKPFIVTF